MTYPKMLRMYSFNLSQEGTDIRTVVEVAAPDIRKALATVQNSNADEESYKIEDVARLHEYIPDVSVPESALIWEPSDGVVENIEDGVFPE